MLEAPISPNVNYVIQHDTFLNMEKQAHESTEMLTYHLLGSGDYKDVNTSFLGSREHRYLNTSFVRLQRAQIS